MIDVKIGSILQSREISLQTFEDFEDFLKDRVIYCPYCLERLSLVTENGLVRCSSHKCDYALFVVTDGTLYCVKCRKTLKFALSEDLVGCYECGWLHGTIEGGR